MQARKPLSRDLALNLRGLGAAMHMDWRRLLWLTVLVASSVAFSLGFACATPFAAFAAAAVLTLPRKDALLLMAAVWLANQAVGMAFSTIPGRRTVSLGAWRSASQPSWRPSPPTWRRIVSRPRVFR
jgi:hypothetical protein